MSFTTLHVAIFSLAALGVGAVLLWAGMPVLGLAAAVTAQFIFVSWRLAQIKQSTSNVELTPQPKNHLQNEDDAEHIFSTFAIELNSVMADCRASLLDIDSTQSDAVATLSKAFTSLKELTERQADQVAQLISGQGKRLDSGKSWLSEFAQETTGCSGIKCFFRYL